MQRPSYGDELPYPDSQSTPELELPMIHDFTTLLALPQPFNGNADFKQESSCMSIPYTPLDYFTLGTTTLPFGFAWGPPVFPMMQFHAPASSDFELSDLLASDGNSNAEILDAAHPFTVSASSSVSPKMSPESDVGLGHFLELQQRTSTSPSQNLKKCSSNQNDSNAYTTKNSTPSDKTKRRRIRPPILSREFSCSFCGNKFFRKQERDRHERTHDKGEGSKKFGCTVEGCRQMFARKDALARHVAKNSCFKMK